jgi:hypothetical protein
MKNIEPIKCGTFADVSKFSPDVRRQMQADRIRAEADMDGCHCNGGMQSYGCPAYDKKTCIWHPSVFARIKELENELKK